MASLKISFEALRPGLTLTSSGYFSSHPGHRNQVLFWLEHPRAVFQLDPAKVLYLDLN